MVPRLLAEPENRNGTLEPWNHYCCWVAGWVNEHLWCRWNFSPSHWFNPPILDYPDWILIHVNPYPSIAINPVSPRVAGKGCSSWNPLRLPTMANPLVSVSFPLKINPAGGPSTLIRSPSPSPVWPGGAPSHQLCPVLTVPWKRRPRGVVKFLGGDANLSIEFWWNLTGMFFF